MKKVIALCAALVAVSIGGCGTVQKHQLLSSAIIQSATLRAIEGSGDLEAKAQQIIEATEDARVMMDMQGVTLADLATRMVDRIDTSDMPLSEKTLLKGVVGAVTMSVNARIGEGILDPEDKVTLNQVLDWIAIAAQAYAT